MAELSDHQLDRYARHIVLRDIGGAGQARLLESHVLLIGAGGIGSPAIQYLAAAGVGTISVVDDDAISLSNLQRQILYSETQIGEAKVEAAATAVKRLNPDVSFHAIRRRIDHLTTSDILNGVDVVIDPPDCQRSLPVGPRSARQRRDRAISWPDRHLHRVAE
jgi:molybdopterin-synthase adenylyltransferase